jgi:P27 family predicted phage terminase small subunit
LSAAAVEVWQAVVPELTKHGLLNVVEEAALVCYFESVVTHREAVNEVRELGVTIVGSMGGLIKNPACTVQAESARVIRSFACEFGLTPAARAQVKVPAFVRGLHKEADDDSDDFFD